MRRIRRIAIVSGIIVGLFALSLAFVTFTSEPSNRKIAAELVELHRQWETNSDIPALYGSLTDLPFHDGAVGIGRGSVNRRYSVLGVKWEQCYFVTQSQPVDNPSKWTLYHSWYWYRPGGGRTTLATRELQTITAP